MGVVSKRTLAVTAALLAAVAIVGGWSWLDLGGETVGLWVSDAGSALVNALAAITVLGVALSYGPGEAVRKRWLLIGAGVASFAAGDVIWTVLEAGMGLQPWPSAADAFYLAEYGFLFAGIMTAGIAYRGLVDIRGPLAVAFVSGLGIAAAGYFLVTAPNVIADADLSFGEKALSTAYPAADALLIAAPALFVAIVIRRLGTGRLAWPWWWVVAGALMLGAADTAYYALDATGLEVPGICWSLIDSGWMTAHVLLAFAALLARDVERV